MFLSYPFINELHCVAKILKLCNKMEKLLKMNTILAEYSKNEITIHFKHAISDI